MIRLSTGLRNGMLDSTGFKKAFRNGIIHVYSGPQPDDADQAVGSGTLLGKITPLAAALVRGVAATNTLTSSNVQVTANDTVTIYGKPYTFVASPTVEGDVHFVTDADTSLGNLVKAINGTGTYGTDHKCIAANAYVSAGPVTAHAITLTALATGVSGNVITFARSAATLTVGAALFSGGVDGAGLNFDTPAAGLVQKAAAEIWQLTGLDAGVAGWFRLMGNATDSLALSTTLPRFDGSIAVAGGDLQVSNTTIVTGVPATFDVFEYELPFE